MNLTILILILTIIGLLFFYFLKKASLERKENLNIVKEGNRLHLFLSDDHLLSIKLKKDIIDSVVAKKISREIENIKRSIKKVSFINFRNDTLQNRFNKILKQQFF
jgi:hypothetical protein